MKKIFGFLLAAIIIGLTAFTLLSPAANVAPSFELTDLNGKTVNNQNLHGRVTLINFWFPSCPGCVSEMPKLIKMAHDYQGKDCQILGVAVPIDNLESVKNYVAERQIPFAVMFDTNKSTTKSFVKTELYPTSVLINKRGKILKTFVGEPDFAALYQEVDSQLVK